MDHSLTNIVASPRTDPWIKHAEYPRREWEGKREAGGARSRSRLLSRTPIWRGGLVASVLCQLHISVVTRYGAAARCAFVT